VRRERDEQKMRQSLQSLEEAAKTDRNLMPLIVGAVEAYASVGEISDVFRRIHGEFREALTL
jgi:methylmalonyl-CoA mutase N-terminal domain/subunit